MSNIRQVIVFQKLEGVVALSVAAWLYHLGHGNWWLFALLLLAADVTMVGYIWGNRTGAVIYNLGHSYLTPGLISLGFLVFTNHVPVLLFIWFAHIGMDRALGYGLKLESFKHTHLGTIGKS